MTHLNEGPENTEGGQAPHFHNGYKLSLADIRAGLTLRSLHRTLDGTVLSKSISVPFSNEGMDALNKLRRTTTDTE